jgi:hypothetical protein
VFVSCRSGRVVEVPAHHNIFVPVGAAHREGDLVNPATVDVEADVAFRVLRPGCLFIVDDVVEVVEEVRLTF